MDVIHTAIWVSDREETESYYIDTLGLEYTREFVGDDGVTNFYVAGESDTEIQFKHVEGREEPVEPSGIDHLAVSTEDVDAAVERIEEAGYEAVMGPLATEATGAYIAFVEAPDGYVVELIEA